MSAVDEIMAQLPMDQIAKQLGVDTEQALAAVQQALPALLHGVAANAEDPAGAESLSEALGQHNPLDGEVDLDQVDTADGEKIVNHVFGQNTDSVVSQLANAPQAAGLGSGLTGKLLSILAPIVLSYLTKQLLNKGGSAGQGSGGIVQDILGRVLAGGSGGQSSTGGLVQDILGGLLGGGRR